MPRLSTNCVKLTNQSCSGIAIHCLLKAMFLSGCRGGRLALFGEELATAL